MAKGPLISKEVVEAVVQIWAELGAPRERGAGKRVYLLARNLKPRPGLRTVQKIIRDAKGNTKTVTTDPPLVPWGKGWPEDSVAAAVLMRIMNVFGIRRATAREADWIARLSALFDYAGLDLDTEMGLSLWHYTCAAAYARRERAGEVLGREAPYTADLDAMMVFRIWLSDERWAAYIKALQEGIIPHCNFDEFVEAMDAIRTGSSGPLRRSLDRILKQEGVDEREAATAHQG
jgi:hypothetical protein